MPNFDAYEKNESSQSNSAFQWIHHNLLAPALDAGPLAIYNVFADATRLPEVHLAVEEAKPYSAAWYAQNISSGAGAVLPFLLSGSAVSKILRSANGALAGTHIGESLAPILSSKKAANVFGASAFSAAQSPDSDHTRLGNALGTAIGFSVFNASSALTREFSIAGKVAAYPVTGFIGGAAIAGSSQFLSDGRLATSEQTVQSGLKGMVMNTVAPLVGKGFEGVSNRKMVNVVEKQFLQPVGKTSQNLESAGFASGEVQGNQGSFPSQATFGTIKPEWNKELPDVDKAGYYKNKFLQIASSHDLHYVKGANANGQETIIPIKNFDHALRTQPGLSIGKGKATEDGELPTSDLSMLTDNEKAMLANLLATNPPGFPKADVHANLTSKVNGSGPKIEESEIPDDVLDFFKKLKS